MQALGFLSGRKRWGARRAVLVVSTLLIKKAKAFPRAASRGPSRIYHGKGLDHMATPSSKGVWESQCSSLLASVMEGG